MTATLAVTDQLGILPHLVEHYSTVEHPASYVIDGALDTEVRVTFKSRLGTFVGTGKTLSEAAEDVRTKVNAAPAEQPVEQPKPRAKTPSLGKVAK